MGIVEWALILGMSTGVIPGPLMAMVVTQTLSKGVRAGLAVACAPLLTDSPIILVSMLVLRSFPASKVMIGAIGLCGAAYLFYLAVLFWRSPRPRTNNVSVISLRRAIFSNLLNPGPYIFWGTIGGTVLRDQIQKNWVCALLFPLAYYAGLSAVKITIAVAVGRKEPVLTPRSFYYLNRAASLVFMAFAAKLLTAAIPNLSPL
jgi:threonine/homoserine/homoserine lactone efflux protein